MPIGRSRWGIQASWGPSHTGQARWFCAADVEAEPGRHEISEAIAATLPHRSTSVAELGIGLTIGKSLGWTAQQFEALQQEYDALAELVGAPFIGADLSCEAIDSMQEWMRQVGTRSELQVVRDVLSRSGRSIEDWSGGYRRNFTLATVTAQAAAGTKRLSGHRSGRQSGDDWTGAAQRPEDNRLT